MMKNILILIILTLPLTSLNSKTLNFDVSKEKVTSRPSRDKIPPTKQQTPKQQIKNTKRKSCEVAAEAGHLVCVSVS